MFWYRHPCCVSQVAEVHKSVMGHSIGTKVHVLLTHVFSVQALPSSQLKVCVQTSVPLLLEQKSVVQALPSSQGGDEGVHWA